MNTLEEFENAPVGATASSAETNARYVKNSDDRWLLFDGRGYLLVEKYHLQYEDFKLDPTAPTTSREALDLAWELAHEVKEGQTIPGGVRTIGRYEDGDFFLGRSLTDRLVTGSEESHLRTLEPLPDPEPDWLDAPAVLARHKDWDKKSDLKVFERTSNGLWVWDHFVRAEAWDLRDVTPLYPKGKKE